MIPPRPANDARIAEPLRAWSIGGGGRPIPKSYRVTTVDEDRHQIRETMPIEIPTCTVDGCDTEVAGLGDGLELSRGLVCNECADYHDEHLHWPDEEPIEGRRNHNRCMACETSEE